MDPDLTLSLSPLPQPPTTATTPNPPEHNPPAPRRRRADTLNPPEHNPPAPRRRRAPTRPPRPTLRQRRNPTTTPAATIIPPFPWSDDHRATVRSLAYLRSHGISVVGGDVQCKRCNRTYLMELDLEQKFGEVAAFITDHAGRMGERAPGNWLSPARLNCRLCDEVNSVKPVISEKKKSINWLFLFLGQMLGCCTLKHLKYYLKHAGIHRTGAKDRLVFSTYMDIFKKLQSDA